MRAKRPGVFVGAMLGLALGDALGAPFEGGPLERGLWRLIGKTPDGRHRWTDDTQMSLDLAESLTACRGVDQDDLARRFAAGYRWSRGYGPGAARTLKLLRGGTDFRTASTRVFREGSFGNGAAMRAPVVGVFFSSNLEGVVTAARATAVITHAHPLGQEGAVLVAVATALGARETVPLAIFEALGRVAKHEGMLERVRLAERWASCDEGPSPAEVSRRLGNGIAASESCVTAIYLALRFSRRPLLELLEFVAACGGDVDTIGAMSGAIWGAANGEAALPTELLLRVEAVERIREVALNLHAVAKTIDDGS